MKWVIVIEPYSSGIEVRSEVRVFRDGVEETRFCAEISCMENIASRTFDKIPTDYKTMNI